MSDEQVHAHAHKMVTAGADRFANVLTLLERACVGGHAASCETIDEYQQRVDAYVNANWISESEAATLQYGWTLEQAQEHLGQECKGGLAYERTLEGQTVHEEIVVCSNPDGSGVQLTIQEGKIASIVVRGRLPP